MQQENTPFHFKDFCSLDSSPDADFLIHSMDVMSSLPCIQSIKNQAIYMMNLKRGDTVLEVGCGQGRDTEIIAKEIEPDGTIMAIDLSQRMIKEAKKRSQSSNVIYQAIDIFGVNALIPFSVCYADRLLVSHSDYDDIFSKMISLLKPSGKICITDVDALSMIIFPYNTVTQRVLTQIQRAFVNPDMGRKLPALFHSHHLKNIQMKVNVSTIQDFSILSKIFQFPIILRQLTDNATLTVDEAEKWLEDAYQATSNGTFMYGVTFFTVTGEV